MGEDVGQLGGVFRVTDGLQKDFGEQRVLDTPLAESGIIGTAVGLAMRGFRPVCEIQFDGFVFPAVDQIFSQLAKLHYRSQGRVRMPVVVRIPFGGGIGAVEHHSESPESLFAHVPGLKVVACSSPSDAYWMLQQAIATDDPVIFFEPKRRYWEKGDVDPTPPAAAAQPPGCCAGAPPRVLACYGADARDLPRRRGRRGGRGRPRPRGDRPAHALPAGPGPGRRRRCGAPGGWWSSRRRRRRCRWRRRSRPGCRSSASTRWSRRCCGSPGFDTPYPPSRCEDDYLPDLDRVLDAVGPARWRGERDAPRRVPAARTSARG